MLCLHVQSKHWILSRHLHAPKSTYTCVIHIILYHRIFVLLEGGKSIYNIWCGHRPWQPLPLQVSWDLSVHIHQVYYCTSIQMLKTIHSIPWLARRRATCTLYVLAGAVCTNLHEIPGQLSQDLLVSGGHRVTQLAPPLLTITQRWRLTILTCINSNITLNINTLHDINVYRCQIRHILKEWVWRSKLHAI